VTQEVTNLAPSCTLELWNRNPVERALPDLKAGVRLRLYYSPEMVSRQGMLVATAVRAADWEEQKPLPSAVLKIEAKSTLAPAEKVARCRFNVRDWFEVKQLGFYRLVLTSSTEGSEERELRFSVALEKTQTSK
jgi:hypothetical protein